MKLRVSNHCIFFSCISYLFMCVLLTWLYINVQRNCSFFCTCILAIIHFSVWLWEKIFLLNRDGVVEASCPGPSVRQASGSHLSRPRASRLLGGPSSAISRAPGPPHEALTPQVSRSLAVSWAQQWEGDSRLLAVNGQSDSRRVQHHPDSVSAETSRHDHREISQGLGGQVSWGVKVT